MAQTRVETSDPRYSLTSVTSDQDARIVTVTWGDGHQSRLPFIWLRHQLFFPALGRPEQASDAWCLVPEAPDAAIAGPITSDDQHIEIAWPHDASTTRHDLAWLRDNCISDAARTTRQPTPVLWTGADAARFEWFEAADLEDPAGRLAIFQQVRDCGLALIGNTPTEPGTLMQIAKHFGPVRRTHHGSLFNIRSLPQDRQGPRVGIGATAANAQAPHTDEGFRHATLGIMLFHCLKPDVTGAGASIFADGIAAAEALRQSDREAFDFLTTTPLLQAAERNPQERFRTRGRIIATDSEGVVRGVKVADRTLPPPDLPEDKIEPAYRALTAFMAELYDPKRIYERCLQPGELAVFDNQRVLHGRRAFNRDAGERHIQQVSIERDEFHNRFRQLAEQVGRFDLASWEPDAGVLSYG
ncbi:MAG: TauD/TfdA family dioxygenase [Aestuariivirgaceae bacterium]